MIVITPDVFRNILDKAMVKLKDFNVLVFDEAHHARKNHAYKVLVDVHYTRCPPEERPKIFGLTASPALAKENVEQSIQYVSFCWRGNKY